MHVVADSPGHDGTWMRSPTLRGGCLPVACSYNAGMIQAAVYIRYIYTSAATCYAAAVKGSNPSVEGGVSVSCGGCVGMDSSNYAFQNPLFFPHLLCLGIIFRL